MAIREQIVVSAPPARVFEALTTAASFSAMTGGGPATVDSHDGGAFSLFGGMIHGRTVECVPPMRVVQAWRVKTWAPGHYSLVRFDLLAEGTGTRVALEHVGYPEDAHSHLASGWKTNYFEPMSKLV